MAISVEDIKKLRESTGAGMMDAKKALEEALGDTEQAIQVLRRKGQAKAAKRAQREAKAGLIDAYIHMGRVGTLIEVNCETDFVARTDDFKSFVRDMAMQVAATAPQFVRADDVPDEAVAQEKEVYQAEIKDKPENVQKRIIEGKLQKYYAEICLLKQPFIKDPDRNVEELLSEVIAKLGENIVINRFSRMELGVQ